MLTQFDLKLKEFTSLKDHLERGPLWGHFLSDYIIEFFMPSNTPVIMTVQGATPKSNIIADINTTAYEWVKNNDNLGYSGPWPPPRCPEGVYWTKSSNQFLIFHDLKEYDVLEIEISNGNSKDVFFRFDPTTGTSTPDPQNSKYKILTLNKIFSGDIPSNTRLHIYIKLEKITTEDPNT